MGPLAPARSTARTTPRGAWSPDQYMRLIALGTCSLCMLAVVGGILVGILSGTISASILGDYKAGGGLIGVLVVLQWVIKKALG